MKKENKKKVVTLSAMAALLAVVLGMGGKTYAKYFTENKTQAQTATVAKWGLVSNLITAGSAFSTTYGDTVVSGGSNLVVAPGTSGSITYTVSGYAEVDAKIDFSVTNYTPVSLTNDSDATDVYYPIVWTVTIDGTAQNNLENLTDATFSTITYQAANPVADASHSVVINWEWPFHVDDDTDKLDTLLGEASLSGTKPAGYTAVTTLSYQFNVTMTQID